MCLSAAVATATTDNIVIDDIARNILVFWLLIDYCCTPTNTLI